MSERLGCPRCGGLIPRAECEEHALVCYGALLVDTAPAPVCGCRNLVVWDRVGKRCLAALGCDQHGVGWGGAEARGVEPEPAGDAPAADPPATVTGTWLDDEARYELAFVGREVAGLTPWELWQALDLRCGARPGSRKAAVRWYRVAWSPGRRLAFVIRDDPGALLHRVRREGERWVCGCHPGKTRCVHERVARTSSEVTMAETIPTYLGADGEWQRWHIVRREETPIVGGRRTVAVGVDVRTRGEGDSFVKVHVAGRPPQVVNTATRGCSCGRSECLHREAAGAHAGRERREVMAA